MVNDLNKQVTKINKLDKKLISLLAERFKTVRKVGSFKKSRGMPLCDRKTQQEALNIRVKQGKAKRLDPKFIKKLYNLIFDEVLRIEGCE